MKVTSASINSGGIKFKNTWKLWKILHYDNIRMHFSATFLGSMNNIFQTKFYDIFLIYGPNIDIGYLLEQAQ